MQNLNNTVTIPKLSLLYRNIFYKNLIFLDIFINLFKHKYVIRSNEELKGNFERIDKVGENDNYFTIFFFSARNEKVETLSIKNYYIIDKNTNEIYKTSEKDIIEKGIILNDVDTFLKKKGMLVYD